MHSTDMIPLMQGYSKTHHWQRIDATSSDAYGDAIPTFTDMGEIMLSIRPDTSYRARDDAGTQAIETFIGITVNYTDVFVGDIIGANLTSGYKVLESKRYLLNAQLRLESI